MVEVSGPLSVVVYYVWLNVCLDWLPVVRVRCYLEMVCVVLPVSRRGIIYNKNKTVHTLMSLPGALGSRDTGSINCV